MKDEMERKDRPLLKEAIKLWNIATEASTHSFNGTLSISEVDERGEEFRLKLVELVNTGPSNGRAKKMTKCEIKCECGLSVAIKEPSLCPLCSRHLRPERVKLKRLSEFLKHEAWKHEEYGKDFANNGDRLAAEEHQNHAEEFREFHGIINATLEADTLTQGEAREDDRCLDCNGHGQHSYVSPDGPDIDVCHTCEGSGSSRITEVSPVTALYMMWGIEPPTTYAELRQPLGEQQRDEGASLDNSKSTE